MRTQSLRTEWHKNRHQKYGQDRIPKKLRRVFHDETKTQRDILPLKSVFVLTLTWPVLPTKIAPVATDSCRSPDAFPSYLLHMESRSGVSCHHHRFRYVSPSRKRQAFTTGRKTEQSSWIAALEKDVFPISLGKNC